MRSLRAALSTAACGGGRRRHLLSLFILQHTPEDLATARVGQSVSKLDRSGVLVGRHLPLGPLDNLLRRRYVSVGFPQRDQSHYRLAPAGVGYPYDAGFLHGRMLVQQGLNLRWPDFESGGIDHPLDPVNVEEVAFLIIIPKISATEEPLAIPLNKHLSGILGSLPVSCEDLGPAENDLALLVRSQVLQRGGIDHPSI